MPSRHRSLGPPLLAVLLGLASAGLAWAEPFTYQGELRHLGQPAEGLFDFRITPYDLPEDGSARAAAVELLATPVQSGRFTVEPDFGPGLFQGDEVWLLIEVRPSGEGDFAPLQPRQRVSRTPYAQHAERSRIGGGWVNAGPVSGTFNRVSVGTHGYRNAQLLVLGNSGVSAPHLELFENEHDYARLSLSSVGPVGSEHFGFWTLAARTDPTALGGPATDRINFYNSRSGDVMSLLGNGRLGIGVFTPTAALDVGGSARFRALADGAFPSYGRRLAVDALGNMTAAPWFRYLSIPHVAFQPADGGAYSTLGGVFSGASGASTPASAAITLEGPVRIVSFTAWIKDSSTTRDLLVELMLSNPSTNSVSIMTSVQSSGSAPSTSYVEYSASYSAPVFEGTQPLYVRVVPVVAGTTSPSTWNSDVGISAIRLQLAEP